MSNLLGSHIFAKFRLFSDKYQYFCRLFIQKFFFKVYFILIKGFLSVVVVEVEEDEVRIERVLSSF